MFDPAGRVVSGTPSVVMEERRYTLKARDRDGDEASLAFAVTVEEDRIPEFTEAVPEQLYWLGTAIEALALPAAEGGNGALRYTLSPALPEGLEFDPVGRIVSGTPSVVMEETRYTLKARDRDGDEAGVDFVMLVSAPIVLTMKDAGATEGEVVAFVLELSPPPPRPMRVACVTAPVTATADGDYEHATDHRFSIAAGLGAMRVTVPTIEDEEVEGDETFRVHIVPEWKAVKEVEATGTIIDDDDYSARSRVLEAVLATFGRAVGSEAVSVLEGRFGDDAFSGSQVTVGGQRLPMGSLVDGMGQGTGGAGVRGGGREPGGGAGEARDLEWEEVAWGSSFTLLVGDGEEAGSGGWTLWGRTGRTEFSGKPERSLSVDGEVSSAWLGVDARVGEELLLGLALSHSAGEMSYRNEEGAGTVDASLESVLPYGRWTPRADLSLWGLVGTGRGDAELVDEVGRTRAGIGMRLAALGWRKELGAVGEGVEWALKGDGLVVEMESDEVEKLPGTRSRVQRMRLSLEGGREWPLGEHGRLRPRWELGGRWDGGRVEEGYGAELGGGLEYADERLGLVVEARGRYLLAHRAQGFRERGASVAMRFDPGGDGEGVWFGMSPRWGAPESGVESLWGSVPGGGGDAAPVRWAVEGGYRSGEPLGWGVTLGVEEGDSLTFGARFEVRTSW